MCIRDRHTLSKLNAIFKYADDTTLLAPEHTDIDISEEFQHIKVWSAANKLTLNLHKTTELVFKRPRALYFHMPPAVDGINQLDSVKLLGVMFQSNLKMDCHVHYILSQCAQRMYVLRLLQHQGLPPDKLHIITYSLIVSRIYYALPAWEDFCLRI